MSKSSINSFSSYKGPSFIRQRGVSIVELMIVVVLSLVVMLVTTSIYVSNKQTYRFLEQYSMIQENGRFAIYFLRENILQAGFPREVINPFPSLPADDSTVIVQFRSSTDCLGNNIVVVPPALPVTTNTLRVVDGQLRCISAVSGGTGEVLVDGIETMNVVYGEDTSGDDTANTYVTRDLVADWNNIVSVRIALLAAGEPNTLDVAQAITYNLNGVAYPAANDRTPRRVFNTTIPLRNRSKTII